MHLVGGGARRARRARAAGAGGGADALRARRPADDRLRDEPFGQHAVEICTALLSVQPPSCASPLAALAATRRCSALHWELPTLAQALLKHGADPRLCDTTGADALMLACRHVPGAGGDGGGAALRGPGDDAAPIGDLAAALTGEAPQRREPDQEPASSLPCASSATTGRTTKCTRPQRPPSQGAARDITKAGRRRSMLEACPCESRPWRAEVAAELRHAELRWRTTEEEDGKTLTAAEEEEHVAELVAWAANHSSDYATSVEHLHAVQAVVRSLKERGALVQSLRRVDSQREPRPSGPPTTAPPTSSASSRSRASTTRRRAGSAATRST